MKINISILFAFIIPFFITFSFAEKTLLKQLVDEGNQYLITGRFNEAITSFDAAIQQDSSDYILYYKRATAYLSLGKLSSAISDFTAILKLRPGFQKALLERAKIYINIGEFTLAETDLLDHKDHASDEQLKSLLASVQYAKEQYKLGQQALDNQHYDLCIQHMTEVIRISSQNSQWRLLRAQCHFEKGEIEEAIHDYTRIAHLNPSDKNILINLANLNYFSLYEPDKALNQVKQCIHYDPEDRQCKTLFRFIKRIEKEMKKADLPTLLEDSHHTNSGGFVNEIDEAFNKLKDNLNMTIRNIPKRLHLKLYTLACMAQEYKLEQVEKWCNAALKIEPNHVEILKKLGEMKLNINDFEGAVRYLERALEATEQKDRQIRHLLQRAQQLLRQSKRRDYYKILNVNRDADAKTIKKAYRKLAHEWHPDKYNGELAKEQVESKMADINQAYEVLSDPDKRQQFDNGFDPYDPEANQHPFGAQYGGDPFVRFGGGFPFSSGHQFSFHF